MVSATANQLVVGNGASDTVLNNSGGTIEANGGTVYVGYNSTGTVTNAGTLEATGSSSTLVLGYGTTGWTNTGTVTATLGGTVDLGGVFNTSDLTTGTIQVIGTGTVNITGADDNASGPLAKPSWGSYTLDGGTITGGTVDSGAITFGPAGNSTLSGVTMDGSFAVPSGANVYVNGNTQFTVGTTNFGDSYLFLDGTGTAATVAAGSTLSGNVTVYA